MGLFSLGKDSTRCGVLVDIGSGSVLISIICSDPKKTHPDIIWSKREYTPFRQNDEMSSSAKSIKTSIMNVLMALDSEGRIALAEKNIDHKLSFLQVTLTAPWSYTVTKTISFEQDTEFSITAGLVNELLQTAKRKVIEELKENEKISKLGLTLISRTTTDIVANGYSTKLNSKQKAKTLKLFQSNAVAQTQIIETLTEAKSKIIPKSELSLYSFMLPFYYVMRDLYPTTDNFCLVDITYEATEIGVVRNGVLSYCTHMPYGAFSIAREISAVTSVPLEEAYSYLNKTDVENILVKQSVKQRQEVEAIFEQYRERLAQLFNETGDSLSIPKKIYLHGNLRSEPFFKKQITKAAQIATGTSHAVYSVSENILTEHYSDKARENLKNSNNDTALLISAQFFHNKSYHLKFEEL